LQQLAMESNGKRIDRTGHVVDVDTAPVVWGEPGTNGQHAFFQLLHQGTRLISTDFLVGIESHDPLPGHHRLLVANCIAQTEALMRGKTDAAPHRSFPGNRPSTTIVYRKLDPRTLGMLLALYEHRVFTMGAVWNINSFDQFGVELGKQLAAAIEKDLRSPGQASGHDASTNRLIDLVRDIVQRRD
jgi:glucose-6-phosphate isomerase